MTESFEHGDELSGSIKCEECTDQTNYYWFINKDLLHGASKL
jgi:hypothetical protein